MRFSVFCFFFFMSLYQKCDSILLLFYQWFFGFCLFGVLSHSRIFHSYGDVTIDGEGLQIFTYALHSWPSSREPSLLWHGTFVYNGYLRGPVTLTPISERLVVELSLLLPKVCRGWDSNTQPSAWRRKL